MKKTTLFSFTSNGCIQIVNKSQLDSFKGGCDSGNNGDASYYGVSVEGEGEENNCNSGSNDFIPPPGI